MMRSFLTEIVSPRGASPGGPEERLEFDEDGPPL